MLYMCTIRTLKGFLTSGVGLLIIALVALLSMTRLVAAEKSGSGQQVAQAEGEKARISGVELNALLQALEDPKKREEFIGKLKALTQVQEPEAVQGVTSFLDQVVSSMTAKAMQMTEAGLSLLPRLKAIPGHLTNFHQSFPAGRLQGLVGVAILLGLALMVGFLFEKGIRILIEPMRQKSYLGHAKSVVGKHMLLLAHLAVNLLPIGFFYWASISFIHMSSLLFNQALNLSFQGGVAGHNIIAIHVLLSVLIYRVITVVARVFISPQSAENRYVQCSDGCAQHLTNFLRGWFGFLVICFSVSNIASALGVDPEVVLVWTRMVGLIAVVLLIRLVVVDRTNVADWLRSEWESNDVRSKAVQEILGFFASVWHLVAIFIIAWFYMAWALGSEEVQQALMGRVVYSLVVIGVSRLAHHVLVRFIHSLSRTPIGANKTGKSPMPNLDALGHASIHAIGFLALMNVWGLDLVAFLRGEFGSFALSRVFAALGVVGMSVLVWELINRVINDALKPATVKGVTMPVSVRAETFLPVIRNVVKWVLIGLSGVVVLAEFGVNVGAIVAGLSVAGLAVAMGSQKLAQDVITGVFIMMENKIEVGDVITIADVSGQVEAFTIRTIVLRNISGEQHTIPYSTIGTVSNFSKDHTNCLMEIAVGHEADVSKVISVFEEVGAEMLADKKFTPRILDKLKVIGVSKITDTSVSVMSIMKTAPDPYHLVDQEFRRRILPKLSKLGIPAPAVRQLIAFSGKGTKPDLKVAVQKGA